MIPGGSNDKSLHDSLIRTYIGQRLVVTADGVAVLVSWLIYECSDTVEQRMVLGDSNDERLMRKTDYMLNISVCHFLFC